MSEFAMVMSYAGLPFGDDPEHAFVNGVEIGMLWNRMESGTEAEIDGTFHAANREAVERACVALGWTCEIVAATDETGSPCDGWIFAKLTRTQEKPPKFRVIEGGLTNEATDP